ncbi:MAG TPA: endonuclease III [Candidatus Methanofastidiosa archaeon]|nr:endonuclease III [Candidatus Methanofastidiosa archaeon]
MSTLIEQLEMIEKMVKPIVIRKGDPFQTLIKTILSHRTKDENTDRASEALFRRYPDAPSLKSAPIEDVEELVRPAGFYTVKARRIVEVARIVDEEMGGVVPDTKEGLMELPGVGAKTANCVLVFAYAKDAIPVDTHVHRIANRIGWVDTRTPEDTEAKLMQKVPRERWFTLNELLVNFGKRVCRPVSPRCSACLLSPSCRYYRNGLHIKR